MIKRSIALGLICVMGAAVNAAPAPVTDVNTGSYEQRIAALEQLFETRTNAQHRMQEQLDVMQEEVNELRGSVELHNYQLEKILERQRELYLEIDKRIEAVMAHTSSSQSTQNISQQAAPVEAVSMNENEAYDKAVNLILKDKLYEQAIPEFESFLSNYPQSSYASNAHYWLGQLLFNKQDWTASAEQFEAIVTKFPDSTKRADAILKLGISESARGNNARAKQLWEKLLSEYPDSSAANLAKKRLAKLN